MCLICGNQGFFAGLEFRLNKQSLFSQRDQLDLVAIEVSEEVGCEDVFLGALGQDLALFEEEDMAKVGGDFFGMVGHENNGRGSFQLADVVEVLEETFSGQ